MATLEEWEKRVKKLQENIRQTLLSINLLVQETDSHKIKTMDNKEERNDLNKQLNEINAELDKKEPVSYYIELQTPDIAKDFNNNVSVMDVLKQLNSKINDGEKQLKTIEATKSNMTEDAFNKNLRLKGRYKTWKTFNEKQSEIKDNTQKNLAAQINVRTQFKKNYLNKHDQLTKKVNSFPSLKEEEQHLSQLNQRAEKLKEELGTLKEQVKNLNEQSNYLSTYKHHYFDSPSTVEQYYQKKGYLPSIDNKGFVEKYENPEDFYSYINKIHNLTIDVLIQMNGAANVYMQDTNRQLLLQVQQGLADKALLKYLRTKYSAYVNISDDWRMTWNDTNQEIKRKLLFEKTIVQAVFSRRMKHGVCDYVNSGLLLTFIEELPNTFVVNLAAHYYGMVITEGGGSGHTFVRLIHDSFDNEYIVADAWRHAQIYMFNNQTKDIPKLFTTSSYHNLKLDFSADYTCGENLDEINKIVKEANDCFNKMMNDHEAMWLGKGNVLEERKLVTPAASNLQWISSMHKDNPMGIMTSNLYQYGLESGKF